MLKIKVSLSSTCPVFKLPKPKMEKCRLREKPNQVGHQLQQSRELADVSGSRGTAMGNGVVLGWAE